MPDYEDPRIDKLPAWARELIKQGQAVGRSATYWREQAEKRSIENDNLRAEHARTAGSAEYDTWVSTELDGGGEARFGLGTARPVDFGDSSETCGTFTVTYRDGGLDIDTMIGDFVLKPSTDGRVPALRIE